MNEFYYELKIKPLSEYETFLELIINLSTEAIEENDGAIILRSSSELNDIEFGIKTFCQKTGLKCEFSLKKVKNEDWINIYKQSIKATEVGQFYIHPSWEKQKEGLINIVLDPSLAFGSGHHETTSSCLEAISKCVKPKQDLVDVGCGSGILALAAKKLGANVDICDTDELAIQSAKENFEKNHCAFDNAWVGSIMKASKKYDVVVANIVADILAIISKDLKKSMKENGILILSGILDNHLPKVQDKYQDLKQIEVIRKNEWVTLIYTNSDYKE